MRKRSLLFALLAVLPALASPRAQDKGSLNPKPLPALAHPEDPGLAAKELFGRKAAPAPLAARALGFYSRGCLAGAAALPIDGPSWQVMRLSRNRNWGHPELIAFLERFARKAPGLNGWPGLLVGDLSQPRGGPMLTGHASHQIGLDADLWLSPMPKERVSPLQREEMSATNVVAADWLDVDPAKWTRAHFTIIRAAAQEPAVQRIFVNAAIKKAMCREAGSDRAWLNKVRPMWGHNYHFHIRLYCPQQEPNCREQDETPAGDGCDASLAWWFSDEVLKPKKPDKPPKPKPPLTLADLPKECRQVLLAP